jgi:hypothetical protein
MIRQRQTAKALLGASVTGALLLVAPATALPVRKPLPSAYQLVHSNALWATIDVCDAEDQPDTVGVRGSMPGDGLLHDHMYMGFRLQYATSATSWVDLVPGSGPQFAPVGSAGTPRQGGSSFKLAPVAGKPAVTLRGVVTFQWRRGGHVVHTVSKPTSAGHVSLAGADPEGTTAATCVIG